jgi:hypothetical protein
MAYKVVYQEKDKDITGDGTVALLENQCVSIVQKMFGETKVVVLNVKTMKAIMKGIRQAQKG